VSLPMRGSTGFASDVLGEAVELDALYALSGL
jgi:hypothetical protein